MGLGSCLNLTSCSKFVSFFVENVKIWVFAPMLKNGLQRMPIFHFALWFLLFFSLCYDSCKVHFKRLDLRFLEIGIRNFQESQVKSFETHFSTFKI
eukprot:sb/3479224/